MLLLVQIIVIVYLSAVNFYGFMLIKAQKTAEEEGDQCKVKDGKLFICGLLGGALGIFISMFVYRYRLTSLLLMVFMPVFVALTAFIVVTCYSLDFGLTPNVPYLAVNAALYYAPFLSKR